MWIYLSLRNFSWWCSTFHSGSSLVRAFYREVEGGHLREVSCILDSADAHSSGGSCTGPRPNAHLLLQWQAISTTEKQALNFICLTLYKVQSKRMSCTIAFVYYNSYKAIITPKEDILKCIKQEKTFLHNEAVCKVVWIWKMSLPGAQKRKKQKEKGRSLLQCNTLNRAFCSCWAILKWLLNLVRLCICAAGGNGAISRALRQRVRRWQHHTSLGQPKLGRLLNEYDLHTRAMHTHTHTHKI